MGVKHRRDRREYREFEPAARDLLRLLGSDDAVRADAFRQFHERGGHEALLDALTDLEADPVMRGLLAEHLRLEVEHGE